MNSGGAAMSALEHADPSGRTTQVVGYLNGRSGEIVCLKHGEYDVDSPRSPWIALRPADRLQARYASTAPVICHRCGAWLNDESTGYAIAPPHHDYWKRRLLRARGRRDR
jgi:hypothetical protein